MSLRDQVVDVSVKIQDVIVRTPFVKSFRVAVDEHPSFKAGQWCVVKVATDKMYSKVLSISSAPTEKGYLEFTKKISGSEFSSALSSLKRGDTIGVRYPFGNFTFQGNVPKIAFISGGIGITPIRSICRDLADRKIETDVVLLYGNNMVEDIAFKDDLDQLERQNPHFKVIHVLRNPYPGWNGKTGLISEDLIRQEIPDYVERRFFICGPPAMVRVFDKILKEGFLLSSNQVVTEDFVGS